MNFPAAVAELFPLRANIRMARVCALVQYTSKIIRNKFK